MNIRSYFYGVCFGISAFLVAPANATTLSIFGLDYEAGFHESTHNGLAEKYTYFAGEYLITAFGDAPYYGPERNRVGTNLSDGYTGYEEDNAEKIRLERADSARFTMSGLGIGGLYTGYWATYSNGHILEEFPIPVPMLSITFQKHGIIRQRKVSPWGNAKLDRMGYASAGSEPLRTRLIGVDWVEFAITAWMPVDLCQKSIRSGITSASLAEDVRRTCSGRVGSAYMGLDFLGQRNDTATIYIRSFEVQPVPLPASALMLGSAFLFSFFGLRSANRKRRQFVAGV